MNLQELKIDLQNNTSGNYFKHSFYPKNGEGYSRRSFDDLIEYYSTYGVTEKMLLQALYEEEFSCRVCINLQKIVFFKYYKQRDKFWADNVELFSAARGYDLSRTKVKDTKYTSDYLNNLFDTIYVK